MLFSNFLCVVKPDNNMTSGVQEIESWKAHYSKSSTVTRGSLSSLWSILQEFHCIIQIHSGSYCSLTPLWWMMDEISIGWFLHPVVGWNLKDWSSDVCMSELGTFLQPNETDEIRPVKYSQEPILCFHVLLFHIFSTRG